MKLQDYQPRQVFLPLHNRTKRWTVVVAHRRAGKTVAMCADLVIGALETALPKPQFAYLAPTGPGQAGGLGLPEGSDEGLVGQAAE